MRRDADLALVTVFGLGYLRPFTGTWGSLPSVALAAVLITSGAGPASTPWVYNGVLALVALFFTGACVALGDRAEARFYKKDPSQIVADETAGQALVLMFLPSAALATPMMAAGTMLFAFLTFRAMDIIKPWPAGRLQSVPGGWGVVLDDLFAAAYAWGVVQVVARVVL